MRSGPHAPCLADHRPGGRRQGHAGLPLRPPAAGRHAATDDIAGARPDASGVPPRRRRRARRPADGRARLRREDASACAAQIAVEDVRKISGFMSLTPAEGGWRVAVVDGAEDLNQTSANALLKILEEPPRARRAAAGLRRARPAAADHPQPLPPPAPVAAEPDGDGPAAGAATCPSSAADERGRLVTLAEGSPGRALLLAEEEGLAIAGLVDEVLAALPGLPPAARLRGRRRAGPQRDRLLHLHGPAARRHRRRGARRGARAGRSGAVAPGRAASP